MILVAYRLALLLFPPAFRAAFADCMEADFSDGLIDARRSTRPAHLTRWLAGVAWDLAGSITRQWMRTSVPWLTAMYTITILAFVEGLSAALLRSRIAEHTGGASLWTVWSLTGGAVIVLGMSVLMFSLWFIVPNLRRDTPVTLRA
jgi:drug/metabolite transporter (DMT)-like permease